ncbi:MAG TPA: conjugal transfer protein TraF [Elusimicrobiota bacterium]|nr:conjugal transfer protein TraF [Elusimicrobiota bacterium]
MTKTLAVLCAALFAAVSAHAEEWTTMGPRAMGMGGAGVALSQGPLASYWNPAALGRATENSYGFTAPVGVHAALTGPVLAGVKDLQNAKNTCSANVADPACQTQINAAMSELSNPTNGLRVDGGAGGDFKVGKIALFVNGFIDAGAVPRIDNNAADKTPAAIAAGNNSSALIVKGARILEFGAGYGHELPFAPGVYVGGDLKLMHAQVGYTNYPIIANNNSDTGKIFSNLKNTAVNSSNVGVDVGALWDVDKTLENAWWSPKVGLTGRDLNNPKFSQPATAAADGVGGRYAVNPQVRMGAAISPLHWWNLAADLDLTDNITPVDGVKSRQLGVGTEFNVFNRSWINIPLRFGVARNLSAASNMITAGTGINLLHLMVDVSGEFSPKKIDTQTQGDSKSIPQEFGASVSISLLFGGSEDERGAHEKDRQPVRSDKAMEPAKPSADLPPAQTEQIKQNADKAQQELNKEPAQPAQGK